MTIPRWLDILVTVILAGLFGALVARSDWVLAIVFLVLLAVWNLAPVPGRKRNTRVS